MQSSRSPFCWVYPKAHASSTSIIKRFIHDIYICIWWYSSNIDVCLFSSNIYNSKLFLHAHSVGRPLFGHRRWSLLHFCWPNPRWHRRPMDFVDCRCFWTEAPKVSKLIWSVHEYLQHRWQNRLRWSVQRLQTGDGCDFKSKIARLVYCSHTQPSSRDSRHSKIWRVIVGWVLARHGLHELRQGQVSAGPSLLIPSLGSAQRSHLQQGHSRRDGQRGAQTCGLGTSNFRARRLDAGHAWPSISPAFPQVWPQDLPM